MSGFTAHSHAGRSYAIDSCRGSGAKLFYSGNAIASLSPQTFMLTSLSLISCSYAQPMAQQPLTSSLQVPIFASASEQQQTQSTPLVFSAEYMDV